MNKVYKVVWNASIGAWVATSELAKSKTKTKSKVLNLSAAVLVGAVTFSSNALAGTVLGNGTSTPNKCNNSGSVIVGGGNTQSCANSDFAIAVGNDVQSTGRGSIAIGSGSRAESRQPNLDGKGAIAIGNDAIAYGDNSVAIGGQASTTEDFTVSFGHKKGDPKYYQGKEQGTWADDRFLRITNIAEGVKDNDAVNVSQLKSVVAEAKTHYVSINDNGVQGGNYENDGAKGRNSIAVGVNTSSTASDSVAVGSSARSAGTGAVAVGSASETVGTGDVSIGRNASTRGATGTTPGYSNQSIAIGDQTKAIGDQSIAIGADVIARGNSSVAIGGDDVDKIAQDAELSKTYTDITGGTLKAGRYPTTEANHGSTAVGTQAVGTGAFSSAFGMTSKATGDASSAFGVMSNAAGKGASAFGAVAQATGDGASAMGINSFASGTNSTAIGSGNKPGEGATATGSGAAAIGSNAKATGDNAAAVGKGAEATNENAAAIGGGAKASGKNSAAIGGGAVADQENAVAVGQGAQSMVVGGVALGARSRVEAENSVALGQDAVATEATGSSFLTNRDASMSNGVVSVGSTGKERRITNVEDGSSDSDAVTVRQLKNVDSRVNDNAQNITNNAKNITNLNQKLDDTKTDLGNQITDTNNKLDDAKKDLGNQITDTKTELNNTINNTKTELNTKIDNTKTELENKGLNFAGNAGADVHRKLGEKLNIVGGADASTAEDKTSGENVITRTTADGIKVELLKDAKFDSITTGDTVLNDKGVTIKDGPSITKDGINAGDKVISNVADGVNGKDAVNVDQLTKVKDGLDGKITDTNTKLDDAKKDLGNQITDTNNKLDDAKKDLGNQITDTKTELNNTINNTKTELNTKIDNTKTELENKGLNFAGNAGADVHRKLGEKLNIVGGADASTAEDKTSGENVITRTTADGIKVELLKDAKFDSITTGDTVLNDKGVTIKDGPSITKDGINAGDKVISNVADGVNGKDAVNVDQLTKVKDGLDGKITDTNTKLDDAKKDLGNQITDTNNKLDDAKKDLGNQITDTNNKLDDAKKDLGNQITDTKTELNNTINNTKTELNTKIDNTKTELENKGLNFAGNAGADVHRKLGEKLNIVGGADASIAEDKTSGENVITRTTADGIKVELLKDAKFDSITTGDTVLNDKGVTIKDGPSITKDGINAGDKVISNVADGVNGKDAVNVDQLTKVKDGLDGKITDTNTKLDDAKKDLGNQITDTNNKLDDAKKDLGNQITDTKTELNNTINNTKTELNTKIDNTKTELENKGLNFAGNAGADVHRKLGEKLNIVGGADASIAEDKTSGENVITRTTADGIKVELLKDAKFDSITTGDTVLNDKGVTIKDGPSITKDGINAGDKVISNVADGVNGKDAVNVDQLTKVKDGLDGKITDTNTKLDDAKKDLGNQITDTNNKLDDAKKDLGNQITDTNNKLDDAKKDLGNQITDTKTELNNTINNTKTELNTKIDNTKTELENKGLNFAGNAGADVHRKLGEKLNIVGGADASTAEDKTSGENVITRTTADGIKVELLKDAKFDSITTGDTVLNDKGVTIKDGPSITKDGINAGDKVISNVADGSIANGSKDAVNGGQIQNISDSIKNSIGGNTTVNKDGSITTNNIGGTGKDNINDAIKSVDDKVTNGVNDLTNKGLNFAGNAGADVHRKLGEKLNIVGGADASTAEDKTSGENVITRTTADGIKVELLKDAKFDSITTGDTVLNDKGVTIKDGPSITKDGINAGDKVISNVADGVNGKDAVNVDQLTKVKDGLDGKITDTNSKLDDAKKDLGNQITDTNNKLDDAKKDLGNQITDTNTKLDDAKKDLGNQITDTNNKLDDAKKDLGNQITDTKTELNNTINNTKTELNTKIDNTKTELENKGLNFAGNAGADVHRKLGEKLSIVGGADASTAEDKTSGENVITRTTADGIKVELLKDAKFDSITTGDTVLNDKGVTIKDGPSITKDGINAGNKVISNVADGSIANGSKDAVNGGQIQNISDSIKNSIGGNTTVNKDGSITTNNIGGTGKDNINDAIKSVDDKVTNGVNDLTNKGLNFAGNAGADVHRKLGEKLNIVGGADASTAEDKTSGENVITRTTADGIKVELLKDAKFDSITTGDTVLNDKGVTIKDGPSITKDGINAGGKKITNVADGKDGKDAVNVDQLTNVKDGLDGKITDTNNKLDDAKKDLGNQITDTKTELNNTINNTKTELNTKIDNTKTELENKGLNFAGNAGADVHRKLGEKLNIVGGADASTAEDKTSGENVITRTTADGIKVELLKDAKFDSITTGDTVLNDKGVTIKDGPSITKDGINAGNKVISNVADGSIANGSKDAVNGGQIQNISDSIKNSIGGNTTVNKDGSITTNNIGGTGKDNINDAIKSVDDKVTNGVNDLTNKGLNFAGNAGADVHRKLGEKLNIVGGADASTAEDKTSGENVITRTTADGIKVELLKDAKFDSITTGDTVLNDKGVTIKDGPSITKDGINAGDKVISNVADGSIANGSKDAVNGGQIQNISDSIKNSIGGNTTVNKDGSITTNNIGGTGKDNINDAIKSVDDKVTNGVNDLTNKGLNFAGNAGADVHRKLGEKLNIVGGADASTAEDKTSGENVITRTTEDGLKIELLKDAKFDSITTGNTVLNNNGLTIKGGPSITINGIDAGGKKITNVADGVDAKDAVNKGQLDKQINDVKDQIGKEIGDLSDNAVKYDKDKDGNVDKNSVTLGGGDKGTNLKNVADGKVEEGSKDAVNGGQLWDVQKQVDKNSNDIQNINNNINNINNGKSGLVQQQTPNGEITVGKDTGGTSINMAGKDGDRVVQGVKDGEIKAGSNQAVNGGQIHNISNSIKNSIGGETVVNKDGSITTNNIGGTGKNNINDAIGSLNQSNQELGNKINNLGDQLQQVFYDTNKRIDNLEDKMSAGIAATAALEQAPYVPGKLTMAVGAAYYNDQNAVGVTFRRTADNGRWSLTTGAALGSQGSPLVRIGVSTIID